MTKGPFTKVLIPSTGWSRLLEYFEYLVLNVFVLVLQDHQDLFFDLDVLFDQTTDTTQGSPVSGFRFLFGATLGHENERGLEGRDHTEEQVQKNERVCVELPVGWDAEIPGDPKVDGDYGGKDEPPGAAETGDVICDAFASRSVVVRWVHHASG